VDWSIDMAMFRVLREAAVKGVLLLQLLLVAPAPPPPPAAGLSVVGSFPVQSQKGMAMLRPAGMANEATAREGASSASNKNKN